MSDYYNSVSNIGTPYNTTVRFIDENIEKGFGEKTAIYFEDNQITYSKLKQKVDQFGSALYAADIKHENRVILLLHDSPELVYSFYGSIKIGAVPIPLNTLGTSDDYIYYLNHSRAKVLVVHEDLWEKIKDVRQEFAYVEHVVVVSDEESSSEGTIGFNDFIKDSPSNLKAFHSTKDDHAFWLYTSGSTGRPKGVIHSQDSMEYALENYAKKILGITENDVTLSASKLFFAYGLGNGMYFPLGVGASTVLLKDKPTPELIFEAIEKYKPSIFFGVPTLYGAMLDFQNRSERNYDLSSIRLCVSAGENLPATFVSKWKEQFDLDILDGIGSSEALHIYLSNTPDNIKPGSTGRIVPGYEAKIVNENFETLGENEVGELVIKGDSILTGYWSNNSENKKRIHGEWMRTGDQYSRDEDGFFWYHGRTDDMMKVGGIWVSPIEVESVLIDHEDVLEVAVVGDEVENRLIKPKAYVVLKEGVKGDEEKESELKNYVRSNLAKYKYPREITFMDELPKTSSGKIQRFKLKSPVKV
ncbi:benzoate-CoA ligase family protein [Lentibacillus salinarum]|uniref:Benzoate-CoA ligase family protein n=1 Tax=Lentibacillus salinarum TaxID=446820 RepID=A0ABW3ZR29_9BACI